MNENLRKLTDFGPGQRNQCCLIRRRLKFWIFKGVRPTQI